jgi:hypothetical protein
MSSLPEQIIRHHRLDVKEKHDSLMDFCTNGLKIPVGNIEMLFPASNIDGYYVLTRTGAQCLVSGPELRQWELGIR